MKELFSEIRGAVMVTVIFAIVCCGVYPLAVYAIAQTAFHDQANGSLIIEKDGTVRGSKLLGQGFTGDKYFHSRPSSAGNGYDAANSSGSNLGPTSQKLADAITQNVADFRSQNGLATNAPVPADAVTGSGSGLDPHISPASARLQIARVAKARGITQDKVKALVEQFVEPPQMGVFGDARVNVLLLNLALDKK